MKDQTTINYERRIAANKAKLDKLAADAKAAMQEGKKLERDARTHHLCNLGGMLETYLKEPKLFEEDDVKRFLDALFADEKVQRTLDRMIAEKTGHAAAAEKHVEE